MLLYAWSPYFWKFVSIPVNQDRIVPWVIHDKYYIVPDIFFSKGTCFSISVN